MGKSNVEMDRVNRETTGKLNTGHIKQVSASEEELTFAAVPEQSGDNEAELPIWRVRFDVLSSDPVVSFGLDVRGDVMLGRGSDGSNLVDLTPYRAEALGVSRQHLVLRPKPTKLYVIDQGSTNGTRQNGRRIGVNAPYSLSDADVLSLGRLQLGVSIIKAPKGQVVHPRFELADALTVLAKAITSQLKLDEVLNQVLDMTRLVASSGEAAIWLVDEQTGELFLEAERGIEDEAIKRMRLPVTEDTLAGKVVKTGKPLRESHEESGEQIKIKTGYLVEAVLYVPLTLGGVTFGVLAAVHREQGNEFTSHDERLLGAIADFAAIAVQNSRLFEATDKELSRRVSELGALNELSRVVSSSLDLREVQDSLYEQLHKQWQADIAGLWLVEDKTKTLRPLLGPEAESHTIIGRSYRIGEGIIGKVAQTGEAATAHDLEVTNELASDEDDATEKFLTRSIACVPLRADGKVIGVLALFGTQNIPFTDEDIDRLQSFATPVATAVGNARLFAESERERATVRATATMLSQPLMIVNEQGDLVLANQAADELLATVREQRDDDVESPDSMEIGSLSQFIERLTQSVGRATEVEIGGKAFVATVEHQPRVGTIFVMQEVTDMRKLARLRTEFAQAVSHDIRGPLSSITGFARLLKNSSDLTEDERDEFLDEILGGTDRMTVLANQMLDFALLSESPTARHATYDVVSAVTNAVRDLKGAALERSINIGYEADRASFKMVGDATRVYRSALNLIENAIKYSPDNSEVLVTLDFRENDVVLRVLDSGPGIPEEELPHIFEKYYRAKQTAEKSSGIGLGLAMVKATVDAHDGQIAVRNVKGRGAEFTVTLPVASREA